MSATTPEPAPREPAGPAPAAGAARPAVAAPVDELAALRAVVAGPTEVRVERLARGLADPEQQRRRVAEHLPQVLDDARPEQLARWVARGLAHGVRHDAPAFAAALGPIIASAIRRAISTYFEALVDGLSRTLEHSLSVKSIGWRFEAWRTGRPFAEIVLLRTLVYRVEQIFYVHRETGLVAAHAARGDIRTSDPTVVSGMLTAIRDFVRDSFRVDEGAELEGFRVGELLVLLEASGPAVLAAVVRGAPALELRAELRELAAELADRHADALERFDGDTAPFEALEASLEERLRSAERAPSPAARRFAIGALSAVVVVLVVVAWLALTPRPAERVARALRAVPGVALVDVDPARPRVVAVVAPGADARRVAAPLAAAEPGVEVEWLEVVPPTTPAARRDALAAALGVPEGLRLVADGPRVVARGRAPSAWIARARLAALATPIGVPTLDLAEVEPSERHQLASLEAELGRTAVRFRTAADVVTGTTGIDRVGLMLSQLGRALDAVDERRVVWIEGSADASGPALVNVRLRRARAEHVRLALLPSVAGLPVELRARERDDDERGVRFVVEAP